MSTELLLSRGLEPDSYDFIAKPDLYRRNAFRVTGFLSTVTAQELSKADLRIKLMEKQDKKGMIVSGALPVDPPPEIEMLRESLQIIRDPERRILDEFFWFWPLKPGDKEDKAIIALIAGDIECAKEIWLTAKLRQTDYVAVHNLAVLAHLQAIDFEYKLLNEFQSKKREKADPSLEGLLSINERTQMNRCWEDAFTYWTSLLEPEGLWSRLSERVREIDDPRLTTGTSRRIRNSLPAIIVTINVRLANIMAEDGMFSETKRHIEMLRNANLPESLISSTLTEVTKPLWKRLELIGKNSEQEADNNPKQADKITLKYLEQTKQIIRVIDSLFSDKDSQYINIHDEVALKALDCFFPYVKSSDNSSSDNLKASINFFEQVLPIARGATAKKKVNELYDVCKKREEEDRLYNQCWFCKTNQSEEKSEIQVPMYGDIQKTYSGTKYRHGLFRVPRCPTCARGHKLRKIMPKAGMGIGFLLNLPGCITNDGNINFISITIALAIGYGIGFLCLLPFKSRLTKPESTKKDYPLIAELLRKGWEYGNKPRN